MSDRKGKWTNQVQKHAPAARLHRVVVMRGVHLTTQHLSQRRNEWSKHGHMICGRGYEPLIPLDESVGPLGGLQFIQPTQDLCSFVIVLDLSLNHLTHIGEKMFCDMVRDVYRTILRMYVYASVGPLKIIDGSAFDRGSRRLASDVNLFNAHFEENECIVCDGIFGISRLPIIPATLHLQDRANW